MVMLVITRLGNPKNTIGKPLKFIPAPSIPPPGKHPTMGTRFLRFEVVMRRRQFFSDDEMCLDLAVIWVLLWWAMIFLPWKIGDHCNDWWDWIGMIGVFMGIYPMAHVFCLPYPHGGSYHHYCWTFSAMFCSLEHQYPPHCGVMSSSRNYNKNLLLEIHQ